MGVDEIQMEVKVQSPDKLWTSVHFVLRADGRARTVKLMDYRLDSVGAGERNWFGEVRRADVRSAGGGIAVRCEGRR